MKNYRPSNPSIVVALLCFALLIHTHLLAQSVSSETTDYKNNPVWIKMMEDPNVNYYEAVKAYETYWKNHKKPKGEEEEMEMMAILSASKMTKKEQKKKEEILREQQREVEESTRKKLSKKEQLDLSAREEMKYQVKRFENWMLDVKPFVQEDGRILSEQEKSAIWLKQQEEMKGNK